MSVHVSRIGVIGINHAFQFTLFGHSEEVIFKTGVAAEEDLDVGFTFFVRQISRETKKLTPRLPGLPSPTFFGLSQSTPQRTADHWEALCEVPRFFETEAPLDATHGDKLHSACIYTVVGLGCDGKKQILACIARPGRENLEDWKLIPARTD